MHYLIYLSLFLMVACNESTLGLGGSKNSSPTPVGNQAPVVADFAPADGQVGRETIYVINYTDVDNDQASSCSLTDPTNITLSTPCTCVSGHCSVGITGVSIGAASFKFSVEANGATSNSAEATFQITERTPFVSVWRAGTTGYGDESLTVRLPLTLNYVYDFTVDWGDGSPLSHIDDLFDNDKIHTYAAPGDYTITIRGTLEGWHFSDFSQAAKVISVVNLGDVGWKNLSYAFRWARNLESFAGGYTADVTNMSYMFDNNIKLTNLDLSSFDTRNVTDMSSMFNLTMALTTLDLSNFDTRNVTTMAGMFSGNSLLTNLNITSFDTRNVTSMLLMFYGARSLTSLNLTHFDTSKVTTMYGMFSDMPSLSSLNISTFDTSEVTNMAMMFYDLKQLSALDLSHFQTSKVTRMDSMFSNASSLLSLTVGSWDVTQNPDSSSIWSGGNSSLVIYCVQPGGTLFGKTCN